MNIEQLGIRDHMGQFAPFDNLPDALLDRIADQVEIRYFRAGSELLKRDQAIDDLYYIRSGAVEMFRRGGQLFNRLGEGDIFGYSDLMRNRRVRFPVRALEDTLIYFIPVALFEALCEEDDGFADFVDNGGARLRATVEQHQRDSDMLTTRVRRLIGQRPVMVEADTPLQQAALQMREQRATCVLVVAAPGEEWQRNFTDDDGRQWRLAGLLTDRDCCTRVLAEGLAPHTPVGRVMSTELITMQSDESVHEAMLGMLGHHVQHLPILHGRRPLGVLHLSDIVRYETQSSLYLVSNILHQSDVAGLVQLGGEVRATFARLVAEGADSQMIGRAMATIGRSFIRRLLALGEAELGPPPVPYCFMVVGSLARDEQTITSDQDHALVLDDRFVPDRDDDYFAALARFVRDGLADCGYALCKGDIMATNPRWRQPLAVWQDYFRQWMNEPSPERLLHSSIFFDPASAFGEEAFVEQLQALIAERAPQRPVFLAAMARNALNRTPPLGFFRTFVMEKDGEHKDSINLKRRGTAPLVDLVRVHALACGSRAQNTLDRLDDIARTQLLPDGVNGRLRYAFEFLSMVRIRHQAWDIEADRTTDNNVAPKNISSRDRHHLKEVFEALSHAQKFLAFRYPMPSKRRAR